jgi:hypothetical protein
MYVPLALQPSAQSQPIARVEGTFEGRRATSAFFRPGEAKDDRGLELTSVICSAASLTSGVRSSQELQASLLRKSTDHHALVRSSRSSSATERSARFVVSRTCAPRLTPRRGSSDRCLACCCHVSRRAC